MHLLLIRHAENDYMRAGKLAGWTPGVHLNAAGRQQAEALAARLQAAPLAAVYASPLERALETAAPLAAAKGLRVQVRTSLTEIDYGQWSGKSLKALARTKLWRLVQHQPSRAQFPEGESFLAAQSRAVAAVAHICAAHPRGPAAAVTHADVIKLLVAHYLGLPLDLFQRITVDPASITILSFAATGISLVKLNDTGSASA